MGNKSLDGINIVEFDSNMGAAYATMLLAENGARAIKIEPPGGSRERGTPHFHVLNRSKRALELDLDDHASQARIADLIRWADIVVTGFTPARLKQLKLDPESIRRINARAIALGVPPLGSRGPDADFDANDDLVSARGGITGSQWARSGNPVALVFPAASYSAGVMAATAAVAAIVARGANRAGDAVEVSILAGAFSLQTGGIMSHEKMTSLYQRAAGSSRPDSGLSFVRGRRRQVPVCRMRQRDLLGQVRDRNRSPRSGRRPAFRKCAVGDRARALATAQRHHRANHPHEDARRMGRHPARMRRSVRPGDDPPRVHRSPTDARARDAQ